MATSSTPSYSTLTIKVDVSGKCRPKANRDLKVFVGTAEQTLTESNGEYTCSASAPSRGKVTFTVQASTFLCDDDGYVYRPDITTENVEVPCGAEGRLDICYRRPDLTIGFTSDSGADFCPPTAGKDVLVLNAAGDERTLSTSADGKALFYDLVYEDLPNNATSAVLSVVAYPYTCANTHGSCRSFQPTVDRSVIDVAPDCASTLTVRYQPTRSSIVITPKFGTLPVPGVAFRVFDAPTTTGTPLVVTTTEGKPTASFANLRSDVVTVTAEPPPRLGSQPIRLRYKENHTLRVNLGGGQQSRPVDLSEQYAFVEARAKVRVQVVQYPYDSPLTGIAVRLAPVDTPARSGPTASSGTGGYAEFTEVLAGTYCVELAVDPTYANSRTWTAHDSPRVTVTATDSEVTTELQVVPEPHKVQGTVYGPDGSPVAGAIVEVRPTADQSADPFIVKADENGRYEWDAPDAGTYYLTLAQQNGLVKVSINSVAQQDLYAARTPGSGSHRPKLNGSGGDVDPTPFPLLFGSVDIGEGTAPAARSGGDGGGGQSAGATVSAAIRDVLGYRTKTTDPKGFIAALQRSFTCVDKDGHVQCVWTPRSYASTIPADLGSLTGAQASVYERAKSSADVILPLLDGLTSLSADADGEDENSIKSIIRSRLTEIVTELGLEGGPRTQRVDELFERLTGYPLPAGASPVFFDVNTLKGELAKLGLRMGMDRRNVNTITEEENYTNFLIIVDTIATLFVIWQQARAFFVRDGHDNPDTENDAPFLGTQLVLISRQLGVAAETVRECYFAMDSVFLGPAERQTVLLSLEEGGVVPPFRQKTAMLLSEFLDWINRFCTDEGPQLIEEAGTDGVNAFVPTVRRLAGLATSASQQSRSDPNVPPSFFTRRVQLALAQLAGQLVRATVLADAVYERLDVSDVGQGNSDQQQGGWQ